MKKNNKNNNFAIITTFIAVFIVVIISASLYFSTANKSSKNFTSKEKIYKPSLYAAADKGNKTEVIQLLNNGVNVDEKCQTSCKGWTPLMIAAAEGHEEIVDILVEHKANPNAQNAFGRTALQYATRYNFYSIAESLLKAGANPNIKSNETPQPNGDEAVNSPMADALSQKNDSKMLRLLVIYGGGNPNYNFWDFTPLIQAARYSDLELIKYLLANGADKSHKKLGFTALDIAKTMNNKEAVELLSK
ncbi:MAG: ankyrin repeat domain-containing protein [Rickettsiales bacterium]|jgi:ankyrin repeat protein|nr:ankyrin repeat domain-containing protein [Rickettsiales bacterium]